MTVIAIVGPPGAGKSTQARFFKQSGFAHFATGQKYREQAKTDPRLAELIVKDPMFQTAPEYEALAYQWLEEFIDQHPLDHIVLDATPHSIAYVPGIEEALHNRGRRINLLIVLQAPEEVLRARIMERDGNDAHAARFQASIAEMPALIDHFSQDGRMALLDASPPDPQTVMIEIVKILRSRNLLPDPLRSPRLEF